MTINIEPGRAWEVGRDAGLDAIDAVGKIVETYAVGRMPPYRDHVVAPEALDGLLVTVMIYVYKVAPEPEIADEMIATARKWADEMVQEEKEKNNQK